MTLPLRILERLRTIDADRARAIAAALDESLERIDPLRVDVVPGGAGFSVIHVGDLRALRKIAGVHLVPASPGRFLIALEPGTSPETVEVALLDVIESLRGAALREKPSLEALRQALTGLRRAQRVRRMEIMFVRR